MIHFQSFQIQNFCFGKLNKYGKTNYRKFTEKEPLFRLQTEKHSCFSFYVLMNNTNNCEKVNVTQETLLLQSNWYKKLSVQWVWCKAKVVILKNMKVLKCWYHSLFNHHKILKLIIKEIKNRARCHTCWQQMPLLLTIRHFIWHAVKYSQTWCESILKMSV